MIQPISDIVIFAPTLSANGKKQVYQGQLITYTDKNGEEQSEWMFPVTDKCERSATIMGDDYVRLVFDFDKRIQFDAFSFIEYNGQTFFLKETYRPKNNGSFRDSNGVRAAHYSYDMRFVSLANMLTKHICFRHVQVVNETWNEPEININGTLETIYTMMIGSIEQAAQRISNDRLYYKQCLQSLVANASNAKLTKDTDLVTFSFSGTNIADALTAIANGYEETEWFIEENANHDFTLHICKCEDTDNSILQVSDEEYANTGVNKDLHPYLSGGLLSCEYAQEWNGIVQRIIPFGSDRNMVKNMGTDVNTQMMVSYGKRLRLDPNHSVIWNGVTMPDADMRAQGFTGAYIVKDKSGNNVLLGVDKDGAVTNPDPKVDTGIEITTFYDDVYPQCHFKITSVLEQTKRIDGQLQPRFTIEGVAIDENKYPKSVLANIGMFPIKIIEAETLSVIFESGLLNGREFEITNKTTKDEGVKAYSLRFTIVADGDITEGTLIPSGNFVPKVGDEFALFNMKMPDEFIDIAKDELAQKVYDDLIELENTRPEVKCVADEGVFEGYDVYLGRRFEVTSEIFVSDAKFISRVISYSFGLTSPSAVSFSLASAIMEGTISEINAAIGEHTGQIGGLDQRTVNLSRRGWHDATEMAEMLDSLTTEMMLVGVEKNQFAFTSDIRCVNESDMGIVGNPDHFHHLKIGNGVLQHTQKDWIDQHEGRWYINPIDDLHTCNNSSESVNDAGNREKPYYLYAHCIAENEDAEMCLFDMDYCANNSIESNTEYLLLGILSSEFEDTDGTSYRVFNRSNGYTQIAGGTITTEVIQDPTRSLIIDMQSKPPRIIARNGAVIEGNISFVLSDDPQFQAALERIKEVENTTETLSVDISAVKAKAETALQNLSDMASDSKLTPMEKLDLKREWLEIESEYAKNRVQAIKYQVATTAYDTAYNALKEYLLGKSGTRGLIGVGGAISEQAMAITSNINATTFNNKFKTYYDENINILNAISDAINANAGESGQNLIGEVNPYTIKASATQTHKYGVLVGKVGSDVAVNFEYLVNGREYTFCVDKAEKLNSSGTTTKFTVLLWNGNSSTQRNDLDIKDGRQMCHITVPADGTNYSLLIYAGVAGSTNGNELRFTNLALYEGSHSAEFYKEYIKHLTDALKGTTEVSGGMVMTNVLMLKGTDDKTHAGMSGLEDDNILLWADVDANRGSYQNALAQKNRNVSELGKNDITTLFKKDGTAKIGVFSIDKQKARVKVYNGNTVSGIIDIDAESGMKIYQGSAATENNLKVCVVNDKISQYAPVQPDSPAISGAKNDMHVAQEMYEQFITAFTFDMPRSGKIEFTSLQVVGTNLQVTVAGSYPNQDFGNYVWIVIKSTSGVAYYTSAKKTMTFSGKSKESGSGYANFQCSVNLPAGSYKVLAVWQGSYQYQGRWLSFSGDVRTAWVYRRTFEYSKKTTIGIDGLITAVDSTHFFEVINESTNQKIFMAGLPEINNFSENNQVGQVQNLLKEFADILYDILMNYFSGTGSKKSGFSSRCADLIEAIPDYKFLITRNVKT